MADDYDYDHVKTFPTYASKFKELDIFSDIKFVTNDPIVKTCKEKAKQPEGFFFIDLCTRLNKYFDYFSTLKPLDSKHCEYINFWLNDKLKSYNELNLYRRILNHDISLDIFDTRIEDILKYKSKLGVLSNDVVEKINILNKLNEQYLFFLTKKEIGRTVDSELCEHAKKFAEIYNKAIDECSNYNNKYCKALIEFKVKYDKHNGFTRTCPNVQDLTIIPGTRNYELEILRRYASLHGDGTYSVTDVLKTLGKILGGAVVLFLIMKFIPFRSLAHNKKRKKKKPRASSKHQKRDSRQDFPKHEDHDNYTSHGSYTHHEDDDSYRSYGDHDSYPNYDNYHDYRNYDDYNYYDEDHGNQVYNEYPYYNDSYKSVSHNGRYNIQYYSARDDEYMYN